MTGTRYPKDRRGVLLLIILGLLAMFGMVAVAFVVLTGQAKRSARAAAKFEQVHVSPRRLTHAVAMQVFRGPADGFSGSVLKRQCLLEDLYGQDSTTFFMTGARPACGGQLIEFTPSGLSVQPQQVVGRVLTVGDGPAKGLSTHIVGYQNGRLQIRAFKEICEAGRNWSQILPGRYLCLVNGAPFNGRGFWVAGGGMQINVRNPSGGEADEDYDAVDFQNMLLAMPVPLPLAYPQVSGGPVPVPIPSLHRPALVRHSGPSASTMLRPMDPGFTGSNPYFNATWNGIYDGQSSWDVDNDGDGIADSIWVDVGFQVRRAPDGRLYKPLAAILCFDLDGRLNLNAHGTAYQAQAGNYSFSGADVQWRAVTAGEVRIGGGQFAGGTTPTLPRGLGFGPAEVNLLPLFLYLPAGSGYATTQYLRLLQGYPTWGLDGRYGAANGSPRAGVGGSDDPLSANKQWDYPNYFAFYGSGNPPSRPDYAGGYGSPPDLWGLMGVGLDQRGQPLYAMLGGLWNNTTADDPYEIDLSPGTAQGLPYPAPVDNAFSPAELERLLRPYDVDAGTLPARLAYLTSTNPPSQPSMLVLRRHEFTTESWDLTVPAFAVDPDSPASDSQLYHLVDLLPSGVNVSQLTSGRLLAPEMLAGERFNLNRPWGDGKADTNQSGAARLVIDEPLENNQLDLYRRPGDKVTVPFAYDPSGTYAANSLQARQLYARHLYVLMMLLMDDQCDLPIPGWNSMDATRKQAERVRYAAQWAVNVVDFRDRDSIMTRFAYDPSPFDGWNDSSAEYVVWGCERPELLLTEGTALHDRRTQDLEDFDTYNDPEDPDTPDEDFDQKYPPEGSLFLELYNPWSATEPLPMELAVPGGVQLNRTTPGAADPVWRILIVLKPEDFEKDPDDPTLGAPNTSEGLTVARTIYFTDMSTKAAFKGKMGLGDSGNDDTRFYATSTISPIAPGRYAVVGPGEPDDGNESITYLGGRKNTAVQDPDADPAAAVKFDEECRRIILKPGSAGQQVVIENNGAVASNIQYAVAAAINGPRRLSVTDPDNGYTVPNNANNTEPPSYDAVIDVPIDAGEHLRKTGTTTNFCVVHLQRLANPLDTQGFDKNRNPYRTIDSMPLDLHAFNGTSNDPEPEDAHRETNLKLATWERGEEERSQHQGSNVYNLWRQEPLAVDPSRVPQATPNPGSAANDHFLRKHLLNTLSYLNRVFGQPRASADMYRGDPNRPFPWLTWLNRPFANQYELLLVPAPRSSKLLAMYRIVRQGDTVRPYSPREGQIPFPHLPDFFHSATATSGANPPKPPRFYRLLDLVGVPSPYVGTEVQARPDLAKNTGGPGDQHFFHPPFNRIPLYREPGRVNVNTLFSPAVGEGLVNYAPGLWDMKLWHQFVVSRRGYGAAPGGGNEQTIQNAMLSINASYPTRFANPFRPWSGAHLMPPAVKNSRPQNWPEVNATFLRPAPPPTPGDTSEQPPLFEQSSNHQYNETDQNPYFRYQAFQRLGNLVTTRSNVYAVWITVGHFEVDQNHRLGQELGIDTGDVKRHRAFYIFDRSIPVGFMPGQDLNVEKAILLRRFIE